MVTINKYHYVHKKAILNYKMNLYKLILSKEVPKVSFVKHIPYFNVATNQYEGSISVYSLYNNQSVIDFIKQNVSTKDVLNYASTKN